MSLGSITLYIMRLSCLSNLMLAYAYGLISGYMMFEFAACTGLGSVITDFTGYIMNLLGSPCSFFSAISSCPALVAGIAAAWPLFIFLYTDPLRPLILSIILKTPHDFLFAGGASSFFRAS